MLRFLPQLRRAEGAVRLHFESREASEADEELEEAEELEELEERAETEERAVAGESGRGPHAPRVRLLLSATPEGLVSLGFALDERSETRRDATPGDTPRVRLLLTLTPNGRVRLGFALDEPSSGERRGAASVEARVVLTPMPDGTAALRLAVVRSGAGGRGVDGAGDDGVHGRPRRAAARQGVECLAGAGGGAAHGGGPL